MDRDGFKLPANAGTVEGRNRRIRNTAAIVGGIIVCMATSLISRYSSAAQVTPPQTRVITTEYELSGGAIVSDGLFLADDELVDSVLFIPNGDETPVRASMIKIEQNEGPKYIGVNDFEGIASNGKDEVYFIGSHNGSKGKSRPERSFLIIAKWKEGKKGKKELKANAVYRNLLDDIKRAAPVAKIPMDKSAATLEDRLDIEGLALKDKTLLLGCRGPLGSDDKAIVFACGMEDITKTVSNLQLPRKERRKLPRRDLELRLKPYALDLGKGGIRGMDWDEGGKRFLVLSGPIDDPEKGNAAVPCALWSFDASFQNRKLLYTFDPKEIKAAKDGAPEAVCRLKDGRIVVGLDTGGTTPTRLLVFPKGAL